MRRLLVTAAAALAAAACSGTPAPVTIRGTLTPALSLSDAYSGFNCAFRAPVPGQQVTVTDPSGKVIGTGTLGQWRHDTVKVSGVTVYRCDMPFTVTGVPPQQRYGIQAAGSAGTTWVTSVSGPVSIDAS